MDANSGNRRCGLHGASDGLRVCVTRASRHGATQAARPWPRRRAAICLLRRRRSRASSRSLRAIRPQRACPLPPGAGFQRTRPLGTVAAVRHRATRPPSQAAAAPTAPGGYDSLLRTQTSRPIPGSAPSRGTAAPSSASTAASTSTARSGRGSSASRRCTRLVPGRRRTTGLGRPTPCGRSFTCTATYRTAVANNNNVANAQTVWANRLNLDIDFWLTATERFHMFWGPLDEGQQFSGRHFRRRPSGCRRSLRRL